MNVALDATPLTVPTGGIRRYTEELTRALARNFPTDRFILVSDQPFAMPAHVPDNLKRGGGPHNALERRWWLWGVQREMSRDCAEVFHGTDFSVPYLGLRPSVLTLHDLSPWMDAAWHQDAERVRLRTPFLIRLSLATMIITVSEAVRRQAIARFAIHPSRIVSVPLAAWSTAQSAVDRREHRSPYFLFVGTLEPRKNIGLIVDAWRVIRRQFAVDLIIAGRSRHDAPLLREEPGLHLTGPLPDESLQSLYSGALAFLYPSFYEGFGLPVLEAMQSGAAVLASNDPALMEVSGGAAVHLDARNPKEWTDAMTSAITQPQWVESLRARSRRRARDFSWDRTACLTRETYDEAIRRF